MVRQPPAPASVAQFASLPPARYAAVIEYMSDWSNDAALMALTKDPRRFFTERHEAYVRFIRLMRYSPGLRAYFLASPLLRPGMRILEAGCGTGALTMAVHRALIRRGIPLYSLHAFDLTPAMLEHLRATIDQRGLDRIELAEANVLDLDGLPLLWRNYDLIVSASMLEYVPRGRFVEALVGLRDRLKDGGDFVLFMTRRNPFTRIIVGRLWQSNLYSASELANAFQQAGFSKFTFGKFPPAVRQLAIWGHIVEAKR